MKLVTYLHDGKEAVGVLREDGAAVRPLRFPDMNALIEAPRSQLLSAVKNADASLPLSAVTLLAMPEDRVLFGVLTLLGTSALLLIPLERPLRRLPARAGLAGSFTLFLLLRDVNTGFLGFEGAHLAALPEELYRNLLTAFLGFPPADFYSTDYFSLLPWFFLFLTGYFLRRVQLDRQARPERDIRLPVFSTLGRHSLLIYLVHQPLVFGLLTGLELLLKK